MGALLIYVLAMSLGIFTILTSGMIKIVTALLVVGPLAALVCHARIPREGQVTLPKR